MRFFIALAIILGLVAIPRPAAADEFHDSTYQAEKGDPGCGRPANVVVTGCGASPQWMRAAKERASETNLLRLSVSRNAADKPTACNVRIGKAALRYLASGNYAFLFGLWLAQYHPELLQPGECTMPVVPSLL